MANCSSAWRKNARTQDRQASPLFLLPLSLIKPLPVGSATFSQPHWSPAHSWTATNIYHAQRPTKAQHCAPVPGETTVARRGVRPALYSPEGQGQCHRNHHKVRRGRDIRSPYQTRHRPRHRRRAHVPEIPRPTRRRHHIRARKPAARSSSAASSPASRARRTSKPLSWPSALPWESGDYHLWGGGGMGNFNAETETEWVVMAVYGLS